MYLLDRPLSERWESLLACEDLEPPSPEALAEAEEISAEIERETRDNQS